MILMYFFPKERRKDFDYFDVLGIYHCCIVHVHRQIMGADNFLYF